MSNASPSPSAAGKPRRTQIFIIVLLLIVGIALGALILRSGSAQPAEDGHGPEAVAQPGADGGHGHAGEEDEGAVHAEDAAPKGPHGGQLFTESAFSLELRLTEEQLCSKSSHFEEAPACG